MATATSSTTLPTLDELDAAQRELMDLWDGGSIEAIADRIFAAINQEKVPGTWADVGMLLDFVKWSRIATEEINGLLDKLEKVALSDLPDAIRSGGELGSTPSFTETGGKHR